MRFLIAITLVLLNSCVERTMTLTSDPPGALVYVNDQEIGRTPVSKDFTWYGTYDVQLRMDGYETLNQKTQVNPPLWLWPGIDLFAELAPANIHDKQEFAYKLTPATQPIPPEELIKNAEDTRAMLETGTPKKN